ncbi:hypothetical protein ACPPVO_19500 [Dactylosporangium sp. McL0621]|uniref:hypothetical protein n=1 Tax=Dactylosporangium sp. McL0621 TaxID=3415678 RepID=UPI003CEFD8D7
MGQVLARPAGHGVVLLGYWPYTYARHPSAPDAVEVASRRPGGPATAVVDPARPHGADGIVDVEPGPDHPSWVIALVFTARSRAAGRGPTRHGLEWMLGLV